ncbi:MAG: SUF system NifU family Fe-S cluster assembly protein [Thermotogae bacterium]|jgi:nitrogen fixation NifU-like protein|nr:SUF system NifU family Fe-S cluster assembly protein [Thermotogota bacterium]
MDDLSDLYAEVIMDHQRHPRNFGKLENFDREVQMTNSSCGDQISLQVKFENEKIKDLKFSGMGCAISMASASVMTEVMKGLSIEEARRFSDEFLEMVKAGKIPSDDLKDAKVFGGVYKYPMRVKCATLAWYALQKAIE